MNNWIPPDTALTGQSVSLLPLHRSHFKELLPLSKDKRIWQHYVYDGTDTETFIHTLESALADRDKGTQLPFVIFDRIGNKLIGGTRFMDLQPNHLKLEIGSTWIHPDYWGSIINIECKLMLLTYCFETLSTIRVQLKTDENNVRSRKAIEKIGATFEGILRNDMLRSNLSKRNSAYYSILDTEWATVKKNLTHRYLEMLKQK